jgi:pimeloyl-ACP methyl ester carboxylesterase
MVLSATARDFRGRPAERLRFGAIGVAAAAAAFGPASLAPPVPALPGGLRSAGWAWSEVRRHEPTALVAAAAALGRFTSREWVGSLEVPATVIAHARDRVVPPHRQQKLAAALPDARVVEVDLDHAGAGRDPQRYAEAVRRAHALVVDRLAAQAA